MNRHKPRDHLKHMPALLQSSMSPRTKSLSFFYNPLKYWWFENLSKHFLQVPVVLEGDCRSMQRTVERTECSTVGQAVGFVKGSGIDKPGFHLVS